MRKIWMIVIGVAICSSYAAAEEKLTYINIISRLTDLERLAILPPEGERCAQCSSYDKTSKYDEKAGKYINWSANGDGFNGKGELRTEGDALVLAEMEGPGCIWRIWSADPRAGHVRIYLDGEQEPAVDLPFMGYFNRQNAPFNRPNLVYFAAAGANSYIPIPYQKSCKIVADRGYGQFFHFTYGTFPKGTTLPTFKRKLSPAESAALDRANEILAKCGSDPEGGRQGQRTEQKTVTIAPEQNAVVIKLAGPAAITEMKVQMNFDGRQDEIDALRQLVLRITWDDEKAPAVSCPLGDFFGTAPGVNRYKSLPLGMTENGFYSFWYMPFAGSAKIELVNDGQKSRKVHFEVTHAPLSQPIEKLGRFHVKWHRDAFLPSEPKRRAIDWTMLKTNGRGRFCGVMLHVWNPKGKWWGEGDEKFFVDGEKFPSTYGTGSEDYFGYAWSRPELFAKAYHCQTISMDHAGHISNSRWHVMDNVPFQKSFEAAIEKYFPNRRPTLYAATAYWYLAAGQTDGYKETTLKERSGYWKLKAIPKINGLFEAEDFKTLSQTGGKTRQQNMYTFGTDWSRDTQLLWLGAELGDTLELSLPVGKTGKYKVKTQLTKAKDYGIVQFYIDGNKLGGPIDLYNSNVVPTGVLDMGICELAEGEHRFGIEIVGANQKAVKGYVFGIDYLRLAEVK